MGLKHLRRKKGYKKRRAVSRQLSPFVLFNQRQTLKPCVIYIILFQDSSSFHFRDVLTFIFALVHHLDGNKSSWDQDRKVIKIEK